MHIARTLDRIEHATQCHWWLLLIFVALSCVWPALALIEVATIAIVTWLASEQYAIGGDA